MGAWCVSYRDGGTAPRRAKPVDVSDLQITIEAPGARVALAGPLCARTVAEVRTALTAAVTCGTGDLEVDLAGVRLLDASGLGVLVGAHRLALREQRRLVLVAVPPRIERLLVATRLNRVLVVEPLPDAQQPIIA